MKVKDVPQDKVDKTYKRGNTSYVYYAEDNKGNMVQVMSRGDDLPATALEMLGNMFKDLEKEALIRIKNGETSPLEYFMNHYQLDLSQFAAQMGFSKRKIKKHFKPDEFKKLDDETFQKYADFLDIDIKELKNFKKGIK